jgi:uncharacterized membrane protein
MYIMPIIVFNTSWMLYNLFLAFLALGFGYFAIVSTNKMLRIVFGTLWLLFLPNTIYIFTDLEHLIFQWPILSNSLRAAVLVQYILFEIAGIATFLLAFFPFEKFLSSLKYGKQRKIFVIICFNFFIAFGMVLGRVERINSWEVFTAPAKVLHSGLHVFETYQLMALLILFGVLCNCIYFLFRDRVLYSMKTLSKVLD